MIGPGLAQYDAAREAGKTRDVMLGMSQVQTDEQLAERTRRQAMAVDKTIDAGWWKAGIGTVTSTAGLFSPEAASSYAVLFFDEADAIFGKRSDVKDAHDKYANTEVAFLLQKMEEYSGISILATNYLQNIDEAFLRRINYIIRFPFPDEEQRERIWRSIFPAETPLEGNIDYRFLAQKMQLAGGSIKNIAITAAFLASGSGESVGMKHILKAYQYELEKSNRSLDRRALAEYATYLDEIQ